MVSQAKLAQYKAHHSHQVALLKTGGGLLGWKIGGNIADAQHSKWQRQGQESKVRMSFFRVGYFFEGGLRLKDPSKPASSLRLENVGKPPSSCTETFDD